MQRNHAPPSLARDHQPGDGRLDHGPHAPGGPGRSAGALLTRRGGGGWRQLNQLYGGELETAQSVSRRERGLVPEPVER